MTSSSNKRRLVRVTLALAIVALPAVAWAAIELVARCGSYPVGALAHDAGSTRIYDARGRLLREAVGEGGVRAEWMPLARISPYLADATIAVEDARFRAHDGVSWRSVARANRPGGQARPRGLGRVDVDDAGRPARAPARPRHHRQARRDGRRAPARARCLQGGNPRAVPEPIAVRRRYRRRRGCEPAVFRQAQRAPEPRRGGADRRAAAGAEPARIRACTSPRRAPASGSSSIGCSPPA